MSRPCGCGRPTPRRRVPTASTSTATRAGRRFFEPGGLPGPGLAGFWRAGGEGDRRADFRNPRRTRAGLSLQQYTCSRRGRPAVR
jgi:hypothetical protein